MHRRTRSGRRSQPAEITASHAFRPALGVADAVLQQGGRAGAAAGAESDEDVGLEVSRAEFFCQTQPLLLSLGKGAVRVGGTVRKAARRPAAGHYCLLHACIHVHPSFAPLSHCCCPSFPFIIFLFAQQALVEEDFEALVEADGGGGPDTSSGGGSQGLAPGELLAREAAAVPLNEAQRREAEVLRAAGITGAGAMNRAT